MKWFFLFLFPLFVDSAPRRKAVNYELYLRESVKRTSPGLAVVDLNLGELKDVDAPATQSGPVCLVRPSVGANWRGQQCPAGSGGSSVGGGLGPSQVTSFQLPTLSDTTLMVVTSGIPVFHNISSLTGSGLSGILTRSVVNNIARVTVGQAGYVNLVWEDELRVVSSNAGTGFDGEFIWAISQTDSSGNSKRSWIGEHPISDPVLASGFNFPITLTTGITPVEVGDYFEINFGFNINQNNRNIVFNLPADNPGLDERFEFIYFPLRSIEGGEGGSARTDASLIQAIALALDSGEDDSESDLDWDNSSTKIIGSIKSSAFSKANIYPAAKSILKQGSNIQLTAVDGTNEITIGTVSGMGGAFDKSNISFNEDLNSFFSSREVQVGYRASSGFTGSGNPTGADGPFVIYTDSFTGVGADDKGTIRQVLHELDTGAVYRRTQEGAGQAIPSQITSSWTQIYTPSTGGAGGGGLEWIQPNGNLNTFFNTSGGVRSGFRSLDSWSGTGKPAGFTTGPFTIFTLSYEGTSGSFDGGITQLLTAKESGKVWSRSIPFGSGTSTDIPSSITLDWKLLDNPVAERDQIEKEVEQIKKEITYNSEVVQKSTIRIINKNFYAFPTNPTLTAGATYRLTIGDAGTRKFQADDILALTAGTAGGAYNQSNSLSLLFNFGEPDVGIIAHIGKSATNTLLVAYEDAALNSDGVLQGTGSAEVGDFDLTLERGEFLVEDWAQRGNTTAIPANKLTNASGGGSRSPPTDDADLSHDIDWVVYETDSPQVRTATWEWQSDGFWDDTITAQGTTTANIRFFKHDHSDASDRGRWFITFPSGSTKAPFTKTIKAFRFKVGTNASVDIPLSRDTTISNAFALRSTSALSANPTGFTENSNVNLTYNFVFTDDTLAYSETATTNREKIDKTAMIQFIQANQKEGTSLHGHSITKRTQRITGFGVAKLLTLTGNGIIGSKFTGTRYSRNSTVLSDGSVIMLAEDGSAQPRLIRVVLNPGENSGTVVTVTGQSSSLLVASTPLHQLKINDDKILIGDPVSTNNADRNFAVISFNDDKTTYTTRRLSSSVPLLAGQGASYSITFAKMSNGDIFVISSKNGVAGRSQAFGSQIAVYKLVVGDSTDSLSLLKTFYQPWQSGDSPSFLLDSDLSASNCGASDFIYEKTSYSYIPIYCWYRHRDVNAILYANSFLKIKNSDTDVVHADALSNSLLKLNYNRFGRNTAYEAKRETQALLLDGESFLSSNGIRTTVSITEDPTSDEVTSTDALSFTNGSSLFSLQATYTNINPATLTDGSVVWFQKNVSDHIFVSEATYIPVNGDVQTVHETLLTDIFDNTVANAVYIRDELKKLIGNERLPVDSIFGYASPRRVTRLPSDSVGKEGENVYLPESYAIDTGFDVSPVAFAETSVDGFGVGDRGWWRGLSGYSLGQLNPDDSEIKDLLLLSNSRIYVSRNKLTNISKVFVNGTSYSVTRVPQNAGFTVTSLAGSPDADYYTIGGGGLPAGDWDEVRFETTTAGTFIPAEVEVAKGLYTFQNSDWQPAGFYAPEVNPDNSMLFQVEETTPGVKQDKNLSLARSGSNFTIVDPFPGVLRLTFNADSSEADLLNRYSVNVPLRGGDDSLHPIKLEIGTTQFPLSYYATGAGQAIYRTSVLATADRVTAAGTITSVNVQLANLSWAGMSEVLKALKTISMADIAQGVQEVQEVHVVPHSPRDGQKIEPLEDLTVQGAGILTVAEATNHRQWGWVGTLGGMSPVPTLFTAILAYSRNTANNANLRGKIAVLGESGKTLTKLWIDGREYALSSAGSSLTHYWIAAGVDSSDIQPGKKYSIQVETASEKAFPDVILETGETYVWTGTHWSAEERGQTADEVRSLIESRVPKQFRDDADVSGQYFQPKRFWKGTAAQEALLTKKPDEVYFIIQ